MNPYDPVLQIPKSENKCDRGRKDALADLTGGVAGRFYTEDVS